MHLSAFSVRVLLCLLPLLFVAGRAGAAVYAVGPGPGCTHSTIQAAINAAEANPGEDFIRIPHSQVWTNQALAINTGQTLSLEGFWSDCNTIDVSGTRTILDGAGGSAAPVLRIEGAGHVIGLDSLTIRNGDVAGNSGKGGGIYYRGNGTLLISKTSISNNTAGLGGGLYLEGTGDAAAVYLLGGVGITGNTAVDSGGGVYAEAVHLYMTQPDSIIAFNKATGYPLFGLTVGGYGGGLVVNNTTSRDGYATIGSAGIGNAGAIFSNTARYGGGVAVLGEGAATHSYLYLHATQAGIPAKIDSNFASERGGGLYTARNYAEPNLWHAAIENNAAPDGAAIYAELGVKFMFGPRPADAAPCPLDAPCGRIAGNVDQDALGQPTGGAVIHAKDGLWLGDHWDATQSTGPRGVVLEGNRGGRLIDSSGGASGLVLSNVLMAGNQVSQSLVRSTSDDAWTVVQDSTIAGNQIGGAVLDMVRSSISIDLRRLLIWQPGSTSFTGGGMPQVQGTIASEAASLGGGPGAIVADPRFVDPARGDYRLRAASPAVDYAPPVPGDDRDVFGLPRDQRIAAVPRPAGYVRDVGAHERASLQPLVLNGDFAADLNLWSGPATAWNNLNISGSGTGSAHVAQSGIAAGTTVLGARQCIHLPGPGVYQLNGWGRAAGASSPSGTDYVELHWHYRRDGGEACTDGTATAQGVHHLGSIGDSWIRPAQPVRIAVSEAEWTHNSSITVTLAVRDGNSGSPAAVAGWFDGITLQWEAGTGDVIFEDGFDGR